MNNLKRQIPEDEDEEEEEERYEDEDEDEKNGFSIRENGRVKKITSRLVRR